MAEVISKAAAFLPICHYNNDDNKGQMGNLTCSFSVRSKSKFIGCCSLKGVFVGSRLDDEYVWSHLRGNSHFVDAKMGLSIGKAQRWWEKGLKQNMKEVSSGYLLKAGDQLVVVDFFSPGCGGCKALHPKICQLAEMNPEIQFLQVNYEEHKSMCYSLNVHALPFFRFYRGSEGRVCSFSCTNATIKKFKDALAKYGPARCSLRPPKGLEEKELLALAANKDLSLTYTPNPVNPEPKPVYQGVLSEAEAKSALEALSPFKTDLPCYSTLVTSS